MREIVLNYLNETYMFTLSTYVSYKLKDKVNKVDVSLRDVFIELETIFSLNEDDQRKYFDEWADLKSIELNNLIVDVQEKLYKLTGKTITPSVEQINGLVDVINVREENTELIDNFYNLFL